MTVIENLSPRVQYIYTNGNQNYPITFPYIEREYVKVMVRDQTLTYNRHYIVPSFDAASLEDEQLNITLLITPTSDLHDGITIANGDTITIYRSTAFDQQQEFPQTAKFSSQKITEALDKLTHQQQEQEDDLQQCFRLAKNIPVGFNTELPYPAANQVIQWNDDGTQLINYDLRGEIEAIDAKADEAVETAEDATITANSAINTANSASTTANLAINTANTASQTANTASQTATSASSKVDEFEETIDEVIEAAEKINELKEAVETATTAATNATIAANTATQKAQEAIEAVDSVEQSDWSEIDTTSMAYIKNKPTIDQTYNPQSTNAQSGAAIAGAGFANDNAVVHLTGDETIAGEKTFTSDVAVIKLRSTDTDVDWTQTPSINAVTGDISFYDKNNVYMTAVNTYLQSDGKKGILIEAKNPSTGDYNATLHVGLTSSNTPYTEAPACDLVNSIVTTLGISKSTPGYVKLGNGIIIQWGYRNAIRADSTLAITFPIAFTENQYGFVSTSIIPGVSTGWMGSATVLNGSVSVTGLTLVQDTDSDFGGYWIAIGF